MIRRPPRATQSRSSAASDVYKRQVAGAGQIAAAGQLGADVVLDYTAGDWAGEISGMVGRRGLDCILDFVGGSYIQKNINLLARNGRLVQIAFLQGSKGELDLMPVLTKSLTITGSMLRPKSIEEKAAIAGALRLSLIHISEPTRPY